MLLTVPFAGIAEDSGRSLTLLIYLCGSNLETKYGAALADLDEITEACAGNRNITVLVMAGGSEHWSNGMSPEETSVLEIGSRGRRTLQTYPAMNMGDPATLSAFLQYGAQVRPADHYALILWDHGGGPMEGVCYHEQDQIESDNWDRLSLTELDQALRNSPFSDRLHLSWIGFDACLMASLETAALCASYTDYMIASQETEPSSGWNYSFLRQTAEQYDTVQTCRAIVDTYLTGKDLPQMLTLSMIDLSGIPEIQEAVNRLFLKADAALTARTFPRISNARRDTKAFGRASTGSEYDLADLYDLAGHLSYLAPEEAASVQTLLEKSIVCTSGNQAEAHGMSIYSPYMNRSSFSDHWLETFHTLQILPAYQQFLEHYGEIWFGPKLADWSRLTGWAEALTDHSSQSVFLRLTDEQLSDFADASVVILESFGSDSLFRSVFTIHDVALRNHTLEADYHFESLYAVSEDGVIMTDPIPFTVVDGYYLVTASLSEYSQLQGAQEGVSLDFRKLILLTCELDEETNELNIVNIAPYAEHLLNLGRQSLTIDPAKWPFTLFYDLSSRVTEDTDGSLLPYPQWASEKAFNVFLDAIDPEGNIIPFDQWSMNPLFHDAGLFFESGYHSSNEADNRVGWKLKFLPRNYHGDAVCAQFLIHDTQGNQYGSNLIPLDSPDIVSTSSADADVSHDKGITLQPTRLTAVRNENHQQLYLRISALYDGSAGSYAYCVITNPIINDMACPVDSLLCSNVLFAGREAYVTCCLDLSSLPPMEDKTIHTFSFIPYAVIIDSDHHELSHIYMNRIEMNTSLDLSMLDIPDPPRGKAVGKSEINGVDFQLLRLEETEGGFLNGTIFISNMTSEPRRAEFMLHKDFNRMICTINGIYSSCGEGSCVWDLPPKGKGYMDFSLIPDENGGFPVEPGDLENVSPQIRQISKLGFMIAVTNQIDDITSTGRGSIDWVTVLSLNLKKPLFLKQNFFFQVITK